MFDHNGDIFKPIIGARLIREEWERGQAEPKGIEGSPAVGHKLSSLAGEASAVSVTETGVPGLKSTESIPGAGIEEPTHIPNGKRIEVR